MNNARQHYYDTMVQMLKGETPALRDTPADHLDWGGVSSVLALFDNTVGEEREEIIRAFGEIIARGQEEPATLAQVIDFVNSLDLTQLQSSIDRIRTQPVAKDELVQRSITNYDAVRELNRRRLPTVAHAS